MHTKSMAKPMVKLYAAALAALLLTAPAGGALAQTAAPEAAAPKAGVKEKGSWMVRGRLIGVVTDVSSSVRPDIGNITVDNAVTGEIDISYFFTPHIALELIAATSKHDVGVNLDGGGDLDLGSVWVLPPTLLLQYHFLPEGEVQPYFGVGLNYTHLYNGNDTATTSVNYDGGFGWALQAGVDVPIAGNWFWNLDLKKVFVEVEATVNDTVRADVDIDPWIIGAGIGYRF